MIFLDEYNLFSSGRKTLNSRSLTNSKKHNLNSDLKYVTQEEVELVPAYNRTKLKTINNSLKNSSTNSKNKMVRSNSLLMALDD